MKKLFLPFLMVLFMATKAQNNLVIFSENGEPFYLFVNGVKQNLEPQTNVKVTDLIHSTYKIKVVFSESGKGEVNQNVYFMEGGEPVKNKELVCSLKMTKKAIYKIRPVSIADISTSTPAADGQAVVHYTTTEPTVTNNNAVNVSDNSSMNTNTSSNGVNVSTGMNVSDNGSVNMNTSTNVADQSSMNTNMQVTQSTTQTQTTKSNAGNTSVGVNVPGMNVNININDNMSGSNGMENNSTVTSQTVTTTTTTYGSTSNVQTNTSGVNTTQPVNAGSVSTSAANVGCAPMPSSEFTTLKKSISSKNFEDAKMKIVKQALDNNCMSTTQVKELMTEFKFDDARLDLAKYAYSHVSDTNNYYKLNDAFKFESSIDELDEYIKMKKNGGNSMD